MNGNVVHESPAQLANLLSQSYAQADHLRRELESTRRRADKAERTLSAFQQLNVASKPGSSGSFDENGCRLLLLEFEARAEAAEMRGDELEARIVRIQAEWSIYDETITNLLGQAAEARNWMGRVMDTKGGEAHFVGGAGGAQAELNTLRQRMGLPSASSSPFPFFCSKFFLTDCSGRPISSAPYHNLNGPPVNPRVRPRAGSLDGAAYPQHQTLSGPGGPPPAKKVRTDLADRDSSSRRSRARPRSQSVRSFVKKYRLLKTLNRRLRSFLFQPSGAPTPYPNGQSDNSPLLAPAPPAGSTAAAAATASSTHHGSSGRSRGREGDRERDQGQIRYTDAHGSRGRPNDAQPRSRPRSRSRSRSRASSASLDEMLLEATTNDDPDRRDGEDVEMVGTPPHSLPHSGVPLIHDQSQQVASGSPHGGHSSSSRRHRSASIERDYQHSLQYSTQGGGTRSRGLSSVSLGHQSLHPSASIASSSGRVTVTPQGVITTTGPGVPGSGPLPQPGQVQTYQTHIFAPPVTGAPVKKTKQANTPNNSSLNLHVPNMVTVGECYISMLCKYIK